MTKPTDAQVAAEALNCLRGIVEFVSKRGRPIPGMVNCESIRDMAQDIIDFAEGKKS